MTENFELVKNGKVKDIYVYDKDHLLFNFSDRVSVYDVILPDKIPDKGEILCKFAEYWFNKLDFPNHMIKLHDKSRMVVKKLNMIPMECIVRGYLYGGLFEKAKKGDVKLDAPLILASKLDSPMFDPTTKSDIRDMPVDRDEAINSNLVTPEEFDTLKKISVDLYNKMHEILLDAGFIIADIKFEFGKDADGNILLADSIGPDEFRLWSADKYEVGQTQESFDKQLIRDWVTDNGWREKLELYIKDKSPEHLPVLPSDLIQQVSDRYKVAYQRTSGNSI